MSAFNYRSDTSNLTVSTAITVATNVGQQTFRLSLAPAWRLQLQTFRNGHNYNNGRNELNFIVTGMEGIAITIELCFKEGGKLTGVTNISDPNDNYFLEKGEGSYEYKGDTISFGPGALTGKNITRLEGERYSTHFGSLRTEGMHVYLTGVTPFKHVLSFY